jgi:hypothetical protein
MKIQYTEFVADPSLRNTITNLPAHVAQVLIAQGSAKAVPLPPYGAKGWLEHRKEISAQVTAPSSCDIVPPTTGVGVEWSVEKMSTGKIVIVKRFQGELTWFSKPPRECPPSIVQQFKGMSGLNEAVDVTNQIRLEKAIQNKFSTDHAEKMGAHRYDDVAGI